MKRLDYIQLELCISDTYELCFEDVCKHPVVKTIDRILLESYISVGISYLLLRFENSDENY